MQRSLGRALAGGMLCAGLYACSGKPSSPVHSAPNDEPQGNDTADGGVGASEPNSQQNDVIAPALVPASSALRLTRAELDQTLRDVLGDESSPARVLEEDEFAPYDNSFETQMVSSALIETLQFMAEDVASRVSTNAELRQGFMPCEPQDADDVACFDQLVAQLGPRFLRRPLSDEDALRYRTLLDFAVERDDFYAAVELLLRSLLQDPEFLYRVEHGQPTRTPGVFVLDQYEVATRLSFLLLGTAPDLPLLNNPALLDPVERRAITTVLLRDPRAERQVQRFHAMWLGYRAIPHEAALNAAFQQETEALIQRVVFTQPAHYLQLFTSNKTYLSRELAAHYGLPEPGADADWVSYPEAPRRAGILSHGSVLSAFGKFTDTSPTQRGIFVQTRLLCQDIPAPPANVDVDQPPGEGEPGCKVARYLAHQNQSGCASCHNLFDPIGIGLENFDRAGRYREHDEDNPECVIDAPGELPGYGEFRGPAELAELLAQGEQLERCFIEQYLRFALGRQKLGAIEAEYAAALFDKFTDREHLVVEWLADWAADPAFGFRREQLEEEL